MKLLENMTEPELAALMRAMGNAIEKTARDLGVEKPLFALLLFNDPAIAQYMANCQRTDVIVAMEECAKRLRAKQEVPRVEFQ